MAEHVKYFTPDGEVLVDVAQEAEPAPAPSPWIGVILVAVLGASLVTTCGFTTIALYIIKTW